MYKNKQINIEVVNGAITATCVTADFDDVTLTQTQTQFKPSSSEELATIVKDFIDGPKSN